MDKKPANSNPPEPQAIPKGMQMLFKTFGIDPGQMQKKITEGADMLKDTVTHFDKELDVINKKLDSIILRINN